MQSIDNVLMLRKGLKPNDPNPDIFDVLWAKKLSNVARDYTVTGNPLSFLAKKAQTAKSTKVTLLPVQAGSGDPSPTNVRPISGRSSVEINGCGKNLYKFPYDQKLGLSGSGNNRTVTTIYYTVSTVVRLKPNTTYYLSGDRSQASDIFARCALFTSYPKIGDVSTRFLSYKNDAGLSFTTTNTEVYALLLSSTGYDEDCHMQLEESSTATAYEPYAESNDVTITFPVMGENLVAPITEQTITRQAIIQTLQISKEGKFVASIYAKNNTDIRGNFICRIMNNSTVVAEYSEDIPSENDGIITCEFTISDMDYTGIQFHISGASAGYSITVSDLQFKVDDHTVYGGTLDVETGVLTVDKKGVKISDLSISRSNNSGNWPHYLFYANLSDRKRASTGICDVYKFITSTEAQVLDDCFILPSWNTYMYIRDDSIDNVADFMTNRGDYHIVYELATPITIQLTPEQIQILKGQNTIWIEDEGATIALTYKN